MINKFCSLLLCSAVLGVGAAEAATVTVNNATGNGSAATALKLVDANFDKLFNANIGNASNTNISTSFFHASVNAVTTAGGNGHDWYTFDTYKAGVQAFFDIDGATASLNSFIKVYDATGVNVLASNNNNTMTDAGSASLRDSFLSYLFSIPGKYYVSVGNTNNGTNQTILKPGDNYTLHISLSDHTPVRPVVRTPPPVPVPAAVWLFGSAMASLLGFGRRKKA